MLKNINISCPNLRTPGEAREFGQARRVMNRIHDVAGMFADKNDISGHDLDTCPDSVTTDRLRFNSQHLPRHMSASVGRSYPSAGSFTGVVNLEEASQCEQTRSADYVNVQREFGGGSGTRKYTETFKLEEVNGKDVYTLRRQDSKGNDSLQQVIFDPSTNLLSYELNPSECNKP